MKNALEKLESQAINGVIYGPVS